MKKGQKVLAHLASGDVGLVGFWLEDVEVNGETKGVIQIGEKTHNLAYREPSDYDAGGSGQTFRTL